MYRRTNSLFSYIAALYCVLYTQLVGATTACPPDYNEWLNTATVDAATVQVCVSNHDIAGSKQLQLTLVSNSQQLRSTVPLDIEGDLRAITLAQTAYALKPRTRAVALELQLRNQGVGFDEERRDLWLFWPETSQLRLVFNQTIELQHWATHCSQECDDTVRSRSELRVLPIVATQQRQPPASPMVQHTAEQPATIPTSHNASTATALNSATPVDSRSSSAPERGEFATLELVSHGELVPGGAEDAKPQPFSQVQRFKFVGERYELEQ
ncbi:MAG TPA: hypothetical protein DCS87_16470 [Rheinheimera sp.]|nr:hypothetical protein [Rheinheimera sp.]